MVIVHKYKCQESKELNNISKFNKIPAKTYIFLNKLIILPN